MGLGFRAIIDKPRVDCRSAIHRACAPWTALTAVIAGILFLATNVSADTVDATLYNADRAYRQGNYQLAAGRLKTLAGSVDRLPSHQQIVYLDLRANIYQASGLLEQAQKDANMHLSLLKRASDITAGEGLNQKRKSLLRLAQIKRELSGAVNGAAVTPASETAKALENACALYREALQLPRSIGPVEPLWEAETRLELASTLALLHQSKEAQAEFAHASRSAETELMKLDAVNKGTDDFVRGIALIRRAFAPRDKDGQTQQAKRALEHLSSAWKKGGAVPKARGKLLIAAAACYQQSRNVDGERKVLEQALREAGNTSVVELEPKANAEALVRLAELIDIQETAPKDHVRRESEALYRKAVGLYVALYDKSKLDRAFDDQVRLTDEGGRELQSIGSEVEYVMQLQLIYTRLEEWDNAIRKAQELRQLRASSLASNDPNYFRTLSALGSLYAKKARAARMPAMAVERSLDVSLKDISDARALLSKASDFWRTYRPQSVEDLAITLNYCAEVCRYGGDFQEADKLLNEAAAYYQTLYTGELSADLRLAEFYLNRGAVQAAIGQFVLADENYKKGADIAGRPEAANVRSRQGLLAMAYLNRAQLYKSQRRLGEAHQFCEQAYKAATEGGLTQVELVPFQLAKVSLLIAEAEKYGETPSASKSSKEATLEGAPLNVANNLSQAVKLTSNILERPDAPDVQLATARHLQALAHYRIFQLCEGGETEVDLAEKLWKEVLPERQRDDPQMRILRVRASNYLVAIALRDVARFRSQAHKNSDTENSDPASTELLTKRSEERLNEAIGWSRDGEQAANEMVAYPAIRIQALLARARVCHAVAQIHRARSSRLTAPDEWTDAAHESELSSSETDDAIKILRNAITIIELPRAMTIGAEEERAEYFAQFAPVFDLLVDLLYEHKRYSEAIEVAEMRRSRTYQDQLRTSGIDLYSSAPPELVDTARAARAAYQTAVMRLNESWTNENLNNCKELQDKFVVAERRVKEKSTAARQLLIEQSSTPEEASSLGGGDDALIYYIGAEKSYLFFCGPRLGVGGCLLKVSQEQAKRRGLPSPKSGDVPTEWRPLRADDVVKLVMDVREGVEEQLTARGGNIGSEGGARGPRKVISAKVDSKSNYHVTDMLLPPELRQKISDSKAPHLIVVPDGALHQLPLELLPYDPAASRKPQYLLDTLPPICYAPSLHIYRDLQKDRKNINLPTTVVSLANPRYRQVAKQTELVAERFSSVGREYLSRATLQPLAETQHESDDVRKAFKDLGPQLARVVQLTEGNATEAKLKEMLKEPVGFLHVAAHGLTSQEYNNLFGALALSTPSKSSDDDDGFLSLYEVFKLRLTSCELAVLSACETNCGTESPLEAGSTMARAFICAGSRRVVCSHWNVDDKATATLIGQFMQTVASELQNKQSVDYAAALHKAKKTLRDNTDKPSLWAPFVLIGPPNGNSTSQMRESVAAGVN